jgi:hypothetical protein
MDGVAMFALQAEKQAAVNPSRHLTKTVDLSATLIDHHSRQHLLIQVSFDLLFRDSALDLTPEVADELGGDGRNDALFSDMVGSQHGKERRGRASE